MDIVKLLFILTIFQFIVTISSAQDVTISPEGQVVVADGESFDITCTDGTSTADGYNLVIHRNMVRDSTIPQVFNGAETTFSIGPVDSSDNGTVFRCDHLITADQSPTLTVLIQSKKEEPPFFIILILFLVFCSFINFIYSFTGVHYQHRPTHHCGGRRQLHLHL